MRKSRIFLVITFSETADAMAAEKLLAGRQIPGRIIPIPRQLSAGCGLSWRTEPELEDRLPVPEALMELLSEKLEGWRMTGVREVSKGFAGLLISAASYGRLYLFLWLALKILGYVLRLVTRIPGIRQMDGLAGMALGLLEAYILIGILFILITAFAHTEAGIYLLEQINDSSILTFMYNHNYLLRIISM